MATIVQRVRGLLRERGPSTRIEAAIALGCDVPSLRAALYRSGADVLSVPYDGHIPGVIFLAGQEGRLEIKVKQLRQALQQRRDEDRFARDQERLERVKEALKGGPRTSTDLAQHLRVTPSVICAWLAPLVARKWLVMQRRKRGSSIVSLPGQCTKEFTDAGDSRFVKMLEREGPMTAAQITGHVPENINQCRVSLGRLLRTGAIECLTQMSTRLYYIKGQRKQARRIAQAHQAAQAAQKPASEARAQAKAKAAKVARSPLEKAILDIFASNGGEISNAHLNTYLCSRCARPPRKHQVQEVLGRLEQEGLVKEARPGRWKRREKASGRVLMGRTWDQYPNTGKQS